MSKYIIRGVPWSNGLTKDVKGCTTSHEVMEKAGLNWQVKKCELVAKMPFGIGSNNMVNEQDNEFSRNGYIYRGLDNAFATYRTDINVPLGLVKSKYEVVQNMDAFNFFDDAIGEDKAIYLAAGCLGFGQKVFVTAKLPIETTVNGDPIDNYLVFSNAHDGSGAVDIMFTPLRVMCTNMLAAGRQSAFAHIRIRHTKTVKERLDKGAEVLRIACEMANNVQDLYRSLEFFKMDDGQAMDYFARLQLTEEEYAKLMNYNPTKGLELLFNRDYMTLDRCDISMRKANQLSTLFDYYYNGVAQKEIKGTGWGVYNAVTGYYSNVLDMEGQKRTESLLWGSANNAVTKAFDLMLNYAEAV